MSDFDHLAERVRVALAFDPRLSERKMFGGLGIMLNGNMALGVTSKGALLVRVGKDNDDKARALPGADLVDFAAKRMAGCLVVGQDALEDEGNLERWLALGIEFTQTLPPK